MSELKVNKVSPRSGTNLTIGDSGDTTNIVGTLQNNGAALVGDISSVVAGTGLSGGGTSGAVTVNIEAAQPTVTSLGTLTGLTTTGDINLGDNDKANFGAGTDLQIYHDGSNAQIKNNTGQVFFLSDTAVKFKDAGGNETFAALNDNGAVDLYYDNSKKLATTATGVVVTGGVALGGTGTANTLDDYEEGTFTPVFSSGVSGSNYTNQVGKYTKIGNQCFFQIQITGNGLGASTAQIQIGGLPFLSNNSPPYGGATVNYSNNFKSDGDITLHIGSNSQLIYFFQYSGSSLLGTEATSINSALLIHGQYITA